jgi:hypothetical protein
MAFALKNNNAELICNHLVPAPKMTKATSSSATTTNHSSPDHTQKQMLNPQNAVNHAYTIPPI